MTPAQLNTLLKQHERFTGDNQRKQTGTGNDLLALAGR